MEPANELSGQQFWEEVRRARQMTPDERVREGIRLFNQFKQWIEGEVRAHFSSATEAQVQAIVSRVVAFQRQREENRTFRRLTRP